MITKRNLYCRPDSHGVAITTARACTRQIKTTRNNKSSTVLILEIAKNQNTAFKNHRSDYHLCNLLLKTFRMAYSFQSITIVTTKNLGCKTNLKILLHKRQ